MAKYGGASLRADMARGSKNIADSLNDAEKGREKQQRRSAGLGLLGKALGFGVGALLPGIGIPLAFAIGGFAGRSIGDLSSNAEDKKVSAGSFSHLFGSEVKDMNRELTSFDKNENASSFLKIGSDLLQGYSLSSAGAGDAFKSKLDKIISPDFGDMFSVAGNYSKNPEALGNYTRELLGAEIKKRSLKAGLGGTVGGLTSWSNDQEYQ